jgi:predicted RecA/RadA family phage recombinase
MNEITARRLRVAGMIAVICAAGGMLTGFLPADAGIVNAVDAVAAIEHVDPAAVAALPETTSAGDGVAVATDGDAVIAVPSEPADGISLGAVTVGLPYADQADDAAASQKRGVVAFDNNNGSTTVPVIHHDGTLQISTVIENARAPKRYDYPIDVPDGATLTESPEGVIAVIAVDGTPLTVFGDAWAKDANGEPVSTHYEIAGNTLTQVVDFTERTAFPVVADPTASYYSYNCVLSNGSSYFMKAGEKLTNCKGSFLQKYINGKKVQTVSLVYNGKYSVKVTGKGACILALTGVVAMVFYPPSGVFQWVLYGSLAAGGVGTSCTGF